MTQTGSEPVQADTSTVPESDEPQDPDAAEHSALASSPIAQAGLGLAAAAFGAVALADATGLDMFGKKGVPGPGFFPVSLSVAVIVLGLLLVVVSAVRAVRRGLGPKGQMQGLRAHLVRAAYVWAGFLVSCLLMPLTGFILATILLIAYLVVLVEQIRGLKAVAVIIAVPVVAYALFVFVLGVELPTSSLIEGL